jgi:hypothetical protein
MQKVRGVGLAHIEDLNLLTTVAVTRAERLPPADLADLWGARCILPAVVVLFA